MDTTYFILQLIASISSFICGIFLLMLYIPNDASSRSDRVSRALLILAYFILGVSTATFLLGATDYAPERLTNFFLFVSSTQSFLVALSVFTLLGGDNLLNRKHLFWFSLPSVCVIIITLIICQYFTLDSFIKRVLYGVMCVAYFIQVGIYVYLFFKQSRLLKISGSSLWWLKYASYSSIAVSIIAIIAILYPLRIVHLTFIAIYSIVPLRLAIGYINYSRALGKKEEVMTDLDCLSLVKAEPPVVDTKSERQQIEEKIGKWVHTKKYMNQGLTLDILCKDIGTNRTYLSSFINQQFGMNYNIWINHFRIEEAKLQMQNNKDLSLSDIAEAVGFADLAHFSKQFKQFNNITPSQWRRQIEGGGICQLHNKTPSNWKNRLINRQKEDDATMQTAQYDHHGEVSPVAQENENNIKNAEIHPTNPL